MNEVIYLEPDEEITSVIDKLKELKGVHSVHLVMPKGAGILQSVVNLKILKREGESLKLDLALVTQDRIGRNLASQVGLTVYDSIDSKRPIVSAVREKPNLNDVIEMDLSEKKPLKPPPGIEVHDYQQNKNIPEPKRPKGEESKCETQERGPKTHISEAPMSAASFTPPKIQKVKRPFSWKKLIIPLTVIIAGFVLVYIYYPKAIINLDVRVQEISEQIEITVNTGIDKISADSKNIPGEILEVNEKIEKEFSATGKKDVGEKARGEVTISNAGGTSQTLGNGSSLENNDLVFVTTNSVDISAATASVNPDGSISKKSGTAKVGVEAAEPGEKYNLGASEFAVANKSTLSANSSSPFTGGLTKQITIVSSDDFYNAQKILEDELKKSNISKLKDSAGKKTLSLLEASVVEESSGFYADKKAGAEAEKFNAGESLSSKIMAFSENNYREAVIKVLGDKIPADKELVLSTDDEVEQGSFNVDFSAGKMKIEGKIKTKLAPKIDYEALKKTLKSRSVIAAENILRENPAFSSSVISMRPSWWLKKIPGRTQAIEINKKYSY